MFGLGRRGSFGDRIRAMTLITFIAMAVVLGGGLSLLIYQSVNRTFFEQFQADVDHAGNVHRYLVDQKGSAAIVNGKLQFGAWVANDDHAVVDTVKRLTGAEATLFQLIDGKLIRVTTTIQRLGESSRGVGTELIGPAAAAFARGEDYRGVGPILGRDFLTRYDTIRDSGGQRVGYVLTAIPVAKVGETASAMSGQLIIALFVGLLVALGVLFVLLHRITRDVDEVVEVARGELGRVTTDVEGYQPGELVRTYLKGRKSA